MRFTGTPFTPAPRRQRSDWEQIRDFQRRSQQAAARRYNLNDADRYTQNADLGRQWWDTAARGERRQLGRANVERMLADARLANELEQLKRDQHRDRALIERMSRQGTRSISRAAVAIGERHIQKCPHCRNLGATPEEAAQVHAGAERSQSSGGRPGGRLTRAEADQVEDLVSKGFSRDTAVWATVPDIVR